MRLYSDKFDKNHDDAYYPDLDPEPLQTHGFHLDEPNLVLRNLPRIRPSALYVFAEKSPMSLPSMQDEKMALTGIGVGGSGGTKNGKIEKVVLPGIGHFFPLKMVTQCADVATNWLSKQMKEIEIKEWRLVSEEDQKSDLKGMRVSVAWQTQLQEWIEKPSAEKAKL